MNGYLSLTKEEAKNILGLCSQEQSEISQSIIRKVIQYCWERTWFELAFEYRGLAEK